MRRSKIYLVLAAFAFTMGCAQGVDMSSTKTSEGSLIASGVKSVFSHWVDANGTMSIDLRQASFNVQSPFTMRTVTGQSCSCQVVTQGQENMGTFQVSSCSGNYSNGLANCSSFNNNFSYTLNNNVMAFCHPSTGCINFY